jgi:hypothetical protein
MLRLRGWHILLFVAASMTVAVLWTFWTNPPKRGIASQSFDEKVTLVDTTRLENGFERAEALAASAMGKNEPGNDEQICHCLARGQSQHWLQFDELSDSCSQFQAWEKISPLYRGTRTASSVDFPRACVLAALPTDHCRTESRVNVLYNAYSDAFSCLDLPRKEWWPWWVSSGLLEVSAKSGIGPGPAPAAIANESAACRRLTLALSTSDRAQPLQSVWNMAWMLSQNWEDVEKAFSEARYWHPAVANRVPISLQGLVESAAWPVPEHMPDRIHENLEKLKMLVWLGSAELGVRTMADVLAHFFLSRESANLPVQMADFKMAVGAERATASAQQDWPHFFQQSLPAGLAGDHETFTHQLEFVKQMNNRLKESTCAADSFLQF